MVESLQFQWWWSHDLRWCVVQLSFEIRSSALGWSQIHFRWNYVWWSYYWWLGQKNQQNLLEGTSPLGTSPIELQLGSFVQITWSKQIRLWSLQEIHWGKTPSWISSYVRHASKCWNRLSHSNLRTSVQHNPRSPRWLFWWWFLQERRRCHDHTPWFQDTLPTWFQHAHHWRKGQGKNTLHRRVLVRMWTYECPLEGNQAITWRFTSRFDRCSQHDWCNGKLAIITFVQ